MRADEVARFQWLVLRRRGIPTPMAQRPDLRRSSCIPVAPIAARTTSEAIVRASWRLTLPVATGTGHAMRDGVRPQMDAAGVTQWP